MPSIDTALCAHCGGWRRSHPAPELLCPSGTGERFKHRMVTTRASVSFDANEVEAMASVIEGLMRGADVRLLARRLHFRRVARKVGSLKERLARQKAEAERRRIAQNG